MAKEISTLVFLGLNSGLDVCKKEISLLSAVLFGGIWILASLWKGGISAEFFAPFAVGLMFLGLSVVSEEQVGMGDGILLLALGTVLSWQELLQVLLFSMAGCGLWGLILMMVFHKSRKTRVPFVPFLLAGYAGGLIL